MELKEKLRQILKERYGIENDAEIIKEARTLQGIDTGYMILTETLMNEKMAVILIALVLLSWLCAMVGYDKVIQAISQFKVHTSE